MRHRRATRWVSVAVVLAGVSAGARGQTQPAAGGAVDDAEWRRQMEARLRQLEQENAQLKTQVGDVARRQDAAIKEAVDRGLATVEGGLPRLTTPDFFDVNKYAAEGDFPGSVRIPGTKTSFQIGGFVQLDAIVDSDRIGNKDAFVVSSIPTGDGTGGGDRTGAGTRTSASARRACS